MCGGGKARSARKVIVQGCSTPYIRRAGFLDAFMQFNGQYLISAAPERVWAALNDVEILKLCIPGCETLEKTGPTTFTGSARLKIGPMSATFKGKVDMAEPDPPHRCVLKGEGQGGVAGFARGESEVLLTAEGAGTVLSYAAKATVGGKLAQVGQRLLDSAARQLADDFFARFAAQVGTSALAAASAPETTAPISRQGHQKGSDSPPVVEGLAPEIWVIGLIAIILILLVLFGLVL